VPRDSVRRHVSRRYDRFALHRGVRCGSTCFTGRRPRSKRKVAGSADKDEIALPEFGDCILSKFRAPLSAAIDGNCVEVNVPLRFVPKKAAPPDESTATPPSSG
jgi:hypothetical protein